MEVEKKRFFSHLYICNKCFHFTWNTFQLITRMHGNKTRYTSKIYSTVYVLIGRTRQVTVQQYCFRRNSIIVIYIIARIEFFYSLIGDYPDMVKIVHYQHFQNVTVHATRTTIIFIKIFFLLWIQEEYTSRISAYPKFSIRGSIDT